MSTKNKTKNLKLPQYQNDDLFDMKEVNEAYKIIDESYKEQNDNYKQAIETSTINGAIDNLELIDARKGKRTLGEKISEIDSQLDTKTYYCKTLIDMKKNNYKVGDMVITLGYYTHCSPNHSPTKYRSQTEPLLYTYYMQSLYILCD